MPYVTVKGVPHYYEWLTASDSLPVGEKPVLVFIHGWAGSARYWQRPAKAFTQQFNCLLYDMRGFGRSVIPADERAATLARGFELETFADDLAGLLSALGISRIYLNAHSMGATVAVFFLNLYGDRVERAILTCNGVFEYDKPAFDAFYKFGGYVVAFRPKWLGKIPLAPTLFMSRFLSSPIPVDEKQAFLADFLTADYETALGTIFTSVSKKATEVMPAEFRQISVPTLLVSGEFDQITPAKLGAAAAALNDKVEYALIPKTGHFPMLEQPEQYLQVVNDFLT
ncbi:MAG: alpha/beta hydrolase [Leptolyngbyaceae cyanobacterium SM1_1_3]|nr:alpha/beta hydrolase [Leptolyngbyaceae cyanobacterium SM1_1_3]NJN02025.1 alpha/beta hydrolase [Leptolyngbyaceae cyanobacterium RM1_1_2]NJO08301.1 alpha/beta hydrolase [Leptolyngbyaceae cyanobacterium SL_1_1]